MVYYGLSLGVNLIGGNIFLNTFLSGSIEIPCYILVIPIMNKLGRRWTTIGSLIAAGISCFVCIGLFNKPGLYYTFVHLLLRLYWALQQARFVLHLCTSPASSVLGSSTSQVCITPLYISCFVCIGLFNKPGLHYTFVHLLLRLYLALQQARFVLHLCTSPSSSVLGSSTSQVCITHLYISCFVCIGLFNKPGLYYTFVHLLLRLYWALQQARFVLHLCTSPVSSVLGSSTSQVCITPLYISCFVCTGLFNKPGLYYTFVHILLRLYWALQQARFVLHICTYPASSVLGSSTSQVCITPLYISCFVCTGLFNKPGLYYTFVHILLRLYWALQQARFVLHLCTYPASCFVVLGSSTSQVCITHLYISCFVCIGLFNKPGLYYTFVHILLRLYWALQQARFVLHLCTSPASSVLGSSTSQVCITPLYISCFVCTGLFNKPGLYYTFVHLLLRLYWAHQQARFVLHLCTSPALSVLGSSTNQVCITPLYI